MKRQFTEGARRAIAAAAAWAAPATPDQLGPVDLLLGLLAESECRAALLLARQGVDLQAVRARWPEIERSQAPSPTRPPEGAPPAASCTREWEILPFSADLEQSLQAMLARFPDCRHGSAVATEHLLLGVVGTEHEVAEWLLERGLEPDALQAEIEGRYDRRHDTAPQAPREAPPNYGPQEPPEQAMPARPAPERRLAPLHPRGQQKRDPGEARTNARPLPTARHGDCRVPPREEVHVLRVLDAASNRGREGLRVVEDYVRFVLDDNHLTGQLKRLRHDLAAALASIPLGRRLAARETLADVGTGVSVASEAAREGLEGVLSANFTRLEESLRTLEEFAKVLDPKLAAELERLRYRAYTLQRAVQITAESLHRFEGARLYVLIDGRASVEAFEALVRSLVDAGVDVLQLRDKRLDDRRLLERARLLQKLTQASKTLFVMNDRPDLAALARADGVHVGQEELCVKDARTVVGPEALVGVSTHSLDQARQAVLDGANYLGVGPVFPSGTKRFDRFPGLELLGEVAGEIRLPAFAIGGITAENVPDVLAAGFHRIAVGGATTNSPEPARAAAELLSALRAAPSRAGEGPGSDLG